MNNGQRATERETSERMAELLQDKSFLKAMTQVSTAEEGVSLLNSVGIPISIEDVEHYSSIGMKELEKYTKNLENDELPPEVLDAVAGGRVHWGHFALACLGIALAVTTSGAGAAILLLGLGAVAALNGY